MLTREELKLRCPSAFAIQPAPHCSPRYSMVNTIDAIAALEEIGFVVAEAYQDARRPDKWNSHLHARHRVVLRHKDTTKMTKQQKLYGCVPELLVTNSSDGSCQFEMDRGILRLACSNGLIVMTKEDGFSFIHKKVTAETVISRARELSAQSTPLFTMIERWAKIRLNDLAVQRYAEGALKLRMGSLAPNYDPMSIVQAQREEDKDNTVWNVFNRAQENGMRGNVFGKNETGRSITARPLHNILGSTDYNKQLWSYTEEFCRKAGAL